MSKKRVKRAKKKHPPGTKVVGRPTVFNDTVQAKILELAKSGATDVELAAAVGVSDRTIRYWKQKHESFFPALKDAKNLADQMVEASLFQRACGYSHPASKFFMDKKMVHDEFTGEAKLQTVVIEHQYTEHYPPSEVAAIFWLKNRQPERWRDRPPDPKLEDSGQTEVVYETEWGGTGEPTFTPPDDGEGSPA